LEQLLKLPVFSLRAREPYLDDTLAVMDLQFDTAHLAFQKLVCDVEQAAMHLKAGEAGASGPQANRRLTNPV